LVFENEMTISTAVRNEAYLAIQPKLNKQERDVYEYLLHHASSNAWCISEELGMLITSARRALFDLRRKGWVQESGKEFCDKTGANVTVWAALPMMGLKYDESGQASFT